MDASRTLIMKPPKRAAVEWAAAGCDTRAATGTIGQLHGNH
jgi:hypothetical protein